MNLNEFRSQIYKKYRPHKIPVNGIFELTGRCNFNCKMCYVHTKSNKDFIKTERSGDWWIAQIDEACKAGMLFALLSGGECLMHPDFKRIFSHLRSRGVYTKINTNGLLLTKEMVSFLKQNPPVEIQISLYGTDDDSYEKITGVRAFDEVLNSIRRLQEAGLRFVIAVTPNSYAPGETERIVRLLKELHVRYSINEAAFTPYDEDLQQGVSFEDVKAEDKIRYLSVANSVGAIQIQEKDLPPVGGGRTEPVQGIRCSAGRVSFLLNHEGYMQPCVTMYHLRVPIDSPEDFALAWQRMVDATNKFLNPVECEGCAYKKACLACPVLRSGKVGNGRCDPEVCELTRKLVAAGVKKLDQKPEACEN